MNRRYDGKLVIIATQRDPFALHIGLARMVDLFILGRGWTTDRYPFGVTRTRLVMCIRGRDLYLI